jgi:hypothetical protein
MPTDIKAVLETFSGEIEHGQGASPEGITSCESALGVQFIGGFAGYLRQYGWLTIGSNELFGLGANIESWRDLTEITLSERAEMYPPLPSYLVTFYNDGLGNQHCLDTRIAVNDEYPIVFWNHELGPDQVLDLICSSFLQWLRDLIAVEQDAG